MAKIYSVNPLKDFGLKIFKQGYTITPIRPETKMPYLKGWQNKKNTEEIINGWASNGKAQDSIGLVTKFNPAVDIDVYDQDVVADLMSAIAHITKGSLTRVGQAPKISFIFRTDNPFRKVNGTSYRSPNGQIHKVEILAHGQQTVIAGIHPDTKQPFKFIGKNPLQVHSDDLPVLTVEQAEEIQEIFRKLVPNDWTVVHGAESASREDADEMDKYVARVTDYDDQNVRDTLELIDPDLDRNLWLKVGFALWHQYELDLDKGFQIWDEWSATGAKYNEKEMPSKWKGFDYRNLTHAPVTFRSVIAMVEDTEKDEVAGNAYEADGSVVKRIDFYLRNFVYYSPNGRIIDLSGDVKEQLFFKGMAPTTVSNQYPDDVDVVKGGKRVPTINIWMRHNDKITVSGTEMGVGKSLVFDSRGHRRLNTYVAPKFPTTEAIDELGIFFKHIDYLIVHESDRKMFWGWMAHLIQKPEERCTFVPLIISTAQGVGKSWLGNVLANLVGVENAAKAKIAELCGEGSSGQYNEYLESVVCVVEETVADEKGVYSVSAKMRDTLTDTRLTINKKFGSKRIQNICTSFLMFSNHINALHIENSDRRIWVIEGPDEEKPYDYYQPLMDFVNSDKCLMQLYNFLKRYDLAANGFRSGGYAPRTALRQKMIDSTSSPEDALIQALTDKRLPFTVFTCKQLVEYYNLTNEQQVESDIVTKLLKRSQLVNPVKKRVNFKNAPVTVWVVRHNEKGITLTERTNKRYLAELKDNQDLIDEIEINGLKDDYEEEEINPNDLL